jgi:hypothetical protein
LVGERHQIAIDTEMGIVSNLQVKIGATALHGNSQQVVDIHAGRTPAAMMTGNELPYEMTEVTYSEERLDVETR